MLEFDILQSGLVFLLLLAAGEGLSRLTRGAAPAVLFAGIGFTLCFWAGLLPEDLGQRAGFSAVTSAVMMMVVVNMGASMVRSHLRGAAGSAVFSGGRRLWAKHRRRRPPRGHGNRPDRPGAGPGPGL